MRIFSYSGRNVWRIFLLALFAINTGAHSTNRNPIRRLYHINDVTIHTTHQNVHALSNFDLTFGLDSEDGIKIELEPNHDVLPAEGLHISYLGKDGNIEKIEKVHRQSHKVYKGTVSTWSIDGQEWLKGGEARLVLIRDGARPLFQGFFSVDRVIHHIYPVKDYLDTKHPLDPEPESKNGERMVMYRDSDIMEAHEVELMRRDVVDIDDQGDLPSSSQTCLAETLEFNTSPNNPVQQELSRRSIFSYGRMTRSSLFGKRQIDGFDSSVSAGGTNLVSTIGNPLGCPTTRKVALVGVAVDCTYSRSFSNNSAATANIVSQMNSASSVWERSFNISLGLANITMFTPDECANGGTSTNTAWNRPCNNGFDIQARLNAFSQWRGNLDDNNSHWTLLSTCNTGAAVGLAWLGQACVNTAQAGNLSVTGSGASTGSDDVATGANIVIRSQGSNEWQILAHETGHTFGAVHDCDAGACSSSGSAASTSVYCCPLSSTSCDANAKYIMNPVSQSGITDFSPCSIGNICSAIGRKSVKTTCLTDNNQVKTFTGPQCGNGIVEPGEDCDCGGVSGCGNDSCCNPTTCKFVGTAVCDDSNNNCCKNCQYAPAGTVCRTSLGVCDPQEVCLGNSSSCPPDVREVNGKSCGDGLQCASGTCTSRNQQCSSLMGNYFTNNISYACDDLNCQLSCAGSSSNSGYCYGLQQNFIDGTVCGGGGTCQNVRLF